MIYSAVLVRYTGEFGVKSARSQTYIEDLIHNNLRRALISAGGQDFIDRIEFVFRRGRLYLNIDKAQDTDINLLVSVAGRLFGIASISPCFRTSVRDTTAVVSVAAKMMVTHEIVPGISKISVRAIQSPDLDIPVLKQDIINLAKKISFKNGSNKGFSKRRFGKGSKWKMGPWSGKVERMAEIEVYKDEAFISAERIKSPGGFPLGMEDPLVALVSGGLDSPVAAWLAMRRGAVPIFVVMDTSSDGRVLTADASSAKEKALENIKVLVEYTKSTVKAPTVYVVPYGPVLDEFIQHGSKKGITCLLCKRFMYRVAEQISHIHDAQGIVTGEILGEQASQTAKNLHVLDSAVAIPVHRPLFGFNKEEVVALAGRIGTFPIANIASDPCKGVPEHPTIGGDILTVEEAEEKIDIQKHLEQCLSGLEKHLERKST